ncbi:MAG TPA: hypothetical protein VF166_09775 [Gemmatimonadaceae bacterium]
MIASNQRSALSALSTARPLVARLDIARDSEEVAADLIEVWPAIETALRTLIGGSALSEQALIHELRQRELISLEQAHVLVEMLAVYERVQRTDYRPTENDITTAREAYRALEDALRADEPAAALPYAPPVPGRATAATEPATEPARVSTSASSAATVASAAPTTASTRAPGWWRGPWTLIIAGAAVAISVAAMGAYVYLMRYGVQGDIRAGMQAYATGQPVVAKLAFTKAEQEHPDLLLPHLYLGRIARDEGDFGLAGTELTKAAEIAPNDASVQRELGAFFLARGAQYEKIGRHDLALTDFDAARNRYVSAVTLDGTDRSAQGYLGCALIELGRVDEGERWITRAGQGGWTACAPSKPATSPGP